MSGKGPIKNKIEGGKNEVQTEGKRRILLSGCPDFVGKQRIGQTGAAGKKHGFKRPDQTPKRLRNSGMETCSPYSESSKVSA